jgi:hypothetical protein
MSLSLILFIVAGLLFILDIVLGFVPNRRAWFLTPIGGILIVIGLLIAGGQVTV